MPLYEYRCTACGHRFEKIQSFSAPDEKECPKCGAPVERLLSAPAIQFKGSGFYLTDYGKAGGSKGGGSESSGKSESSSSSKSDNSSPAPSSGAGNSSGSSKPSTPATGSGASGNTSSSTPSKSSQ